MKTVFAVLAYFSIFLNAQGFAFESMDDAECKYFQDRFLPGIETQYQHYLSCLPVIAKAMEGWVPGEFRFGQKRINRSQVDALNRRIADEYLAGLSSLNKSQDYDLISFLSQKAVIHQANAAFHGLQFSEVNSDLGGHLFIPYRVIAKSRSLLQGILDMNFEPIQASVPVTGYGIHVDFHYSALSTVADTYTVCLQNPSEEIRARCLQVQWGTVNRKVVNPVYLNYNFVEIYDPDVRATEGERITDLRPGGCGMELLRGQGYQQYNYAVSYSDADMAPRSLKEFATGLSAVRHENEESLRLARKCMK